MAVVGSMAEVGSIEPEDGLMEAAAVVGSTGAVAAAAGSIAGKPHIGRSHASGS